ncbi:hypothetical protein ABB30_07635 [Stenotrophomonas ginsengisoli]|uniref:Uncharacterized protein n=1 Tax=Stenotrophomonas ginsengisoli TaxID=336566 RepID=A0A0R0DF79_9GAMM|nr:hypothetical protein [Stenotrophomonas ginsengisoli]KRG77362.1 hypothetical protein ABB30_07635 [Stenotrophomonas ginsengisoli]
MAGLNLRITGSDDDARLVANLLTSVEGIEHVEHINDLMPQMDDPDSSSAGLSDLTQSPGSHVLEVQASNPASAARARQLVQELAFQRDLLVELEDMP